MNVREACRKSVRTCAPNTSVAEAGRIMAEVGRCTLPVVDDVGKLLGLIQSRDLLLLVSLSGHCPDDIPVRAAVVPMLYSCRMADEVREALRTMRLQRTHSLPIVDGAGVFQGMLSLEDLALAAKTEQMAGPSDISHEDIVLAMKMVYGARAKANTLVPEDQPLIWL